MPAQATAAKGPDENTEQVINGGNANSVSQPTDPTKIEDLEIELQRELRVIEKDPNKSLGIDFHTLHIRSGTDELPEADKHQLEIAPIASKFLQVLEICGGNQIPEVKDMLFKALNEALQKRGVDTEGLTLKEIKALASGPIGPREDDVLKHFGTGSLQGQLAALFGPDGRLLDPNSLTLPQAFKAIGIDGVTGNDVFQKFSSFKDLANSLQFAVTNQAGKIESVLDAKEIESEDKQIVNECLTKGLNSALDVIGREAKAHFESHSQEAKLPAVTEDQKREADQALEAARKKAAADQSQNLGEKKSPNTEPPVLDDLQAPERSRGRFNWKAFGKKALFGYIGAFALISAAPALGAAVGLGYLCYLGYSVYQGLRKR